MPPGFRHNLPGIVGQAGQPMPGMIPRMNMVPNSEMNQSGALEPYNPQTYNPTGVQPTDVNYSYQANTPNFHDSPVTPVTPNNPSEVTTLNVVNQLQFLLTAERLKQKSMQDSQSHGSTPETIKTSSATPPLPQRTSSTSPTRTRPLPALPPNWKTATDPEGRVYYYHTVTR